MSNRLIRAPNPNLRPRHIPWEIPILVLEYLPLAQILPQALRMHKISLDELRVVVITIELVDANIVLLEFEELDVRAHYQMTHGMRSCCAESRLAGSGQEAEELRDAIS